MCGMYLYSEEKQTDISSALLLVAVNTRLVKKELKTNIQEAEDGKYWGIAWYQ